MKRTTKTDMPEIKDVTMTVPMALKMTLEPGAHAYMMGECFIILGHSAGRLAYLDLV